ncbi:MAG: hypothetical protein ABUT20_23135 [Bacteroidota bacterium]
MGWKLNSIIINPSTDINHVELLDKLGFKNLTKLEDEPYDSAMYPDKDKVYIGNYKNSIIICVDNLPFKFYTKSLSDTENTLIKYFPDSEICAVSLQSTVNHFGFAVIKAGKKIRVKAGDADIGTEIDIGEPLEQEQELLSKSKIDDTGQRLYYLNGNSDEPYLENQVGENFVFEIFKRYTDELLDEDDDLLDTNFAAYKFSEEPFSFDKYFSGAWHGQFSYGDGYQDSMKGKKEEFTINLSLTNGELKGFCIDANKQSDEPATINGFLIDTFIGFIKRYPFRYVINKNGETVKDVSRQSSNIAYSGLYDPSTDSFKGIWNIEKTKCWGEWNLKRKTV